MDGGAWCRDIYWVIVWEFKLEMLTEPCSLKALRSFLASSGLLRLLAFGTQVISQARDHYWKATVCLLVSHIRSAFLSTLLIAQGCIPKRLPGRPDEALGGGKQGPTAARENPRDATVIARLGTSFPA